MCVLYVCVLHMYTDAPSPKAVGKIKSPAMFSLCTFVLDPAIALATAPLSLLVSTIDNHRIWGGAGRWGPAPIVRRLLGEFTTCTYAHIDPTYPSLI